MTVLSTSKHTASAKRRLVRAFSAWADETNGDAAAAAALLPDADELLRPDRYTLEQAIDRRIIVSEDISRQ
jgi:hypothetical protein